MLTRLHPLRSLLHTQLGIWQNRGINRLFGSTNEMVIELDLLSLL